MSKQKKKFKETAVGKFLTQKIPAVMASAGELLPDAGVLGMVKNLVANDSDTLSAEDKETALAMLLQEEQIYAADRASARSREVELAKAGKMDWMMKVVGLIVLAVFMFAVVAVFFFDLKNENMAHLLLGEILGIVTSIVFYYFGTSKSSSDKTRLLSK